MSLAAPPAIKLLPQPQQKWYQLFPENWVQLAFDRDWRTKRLGTLTANLAWRHQSVWLLAGVALSMLLLAIVNGLLNSGPGRNLRGELMCLVVFGTMIVQLVFLAINLLTTEFERLTLQIIDRLETDVIEHD